MDVLSLSKLVIGQFCYGTHANVNGVRATELQMHADAAQIMQHRLLHAVFRRLRAACLTEQEGGAVEEVSQGRRRRQGLQRCCFSQH